MADEFPAVAPPLRPPLGQPGVRWTGDGALGGVFIPADSIPGRPDSLVGYEPVRFLHRAAGFLIDSVVLLGIIVLVTTVAVLFTGIDTSASQAEIEEEIEGMYPALYIVQGVIQLLYYWLWNTLGWSPGKRLLGLRTVDANGRPPGVRRGLTRALWSILSGSLFGLGYLWAAWDRERRTWHDRLSGTYVVRASTTEATTEAPSSGSPPP